MALEPITRQEQIIAGKDLEPITRMEKFLKDYGVSNYFGETTVKGDTLTWDGNMEGRVSVDVGGVILCRVSDVVLTLDDVRNGLTEVYNDGQSVERTFEELQNAVAHLGVVSGEGFWSFPTDNYDFMGQVVIPEAGIYFSSGYGFYTASLTIPGYTGFETTTIRTIDAKYLPPLVSPGGKKFKLSVDDSGTINTTEVV